MIMGRLAIEAASVRSRSRFDASVGRVTNHSIHFRNGRALQMHAQTNAVENGSAKHEMSRMRCFSQTQTHGGASPSWAQHLGWTCGDGGYLRRERFCFFVDDCHADCKNEFIERKDHGSKKLQRQALSFC